MPLQRNRLGNRPAYLYACWCNDCTRRRTSGQGTCCTSQSSMVHRPCYHVSLLTALPTHNEITCMCTYITHTDHTCHCRARPQLGTTQGAHHKSTSPKFPTALQSRASHNNQMQVPDVTTPGFPHFQQHFHPCLVATTPLLDTTETSPLPLCLDSFRS